MSVVLADLREESGSAAGYTLLELPSDWTDDILAGTPAKIVPTEDGRAAIIVGSKEGIIKLGETSNCVFLADNTADNNDKVYVTFSKYLEATPVAK